MSNTEDRGEITVYELGYLVLPSIPEDSVSKVVDSIKQIISEASGQEIDSEMPHKRNLAYAMSKTVGASKYVVSEAYAGWIKFEIEPEKVGEIKDKVESLSEILRMLLVKAPRETVFTFASAKKDEDQIGEEIEESVDEDDESNSSDDNVVE